MTSSTIRKKLDAGKKLEELGEFALAAQIYSPLSKVQAQRHGQTVVLALLGLARCTRYLLRTRKAAEITKKALTIASEFAPEERTRVLFALANHYDALGEGSEALRYLTDAEKGEGTVRLDQVVSWFRARADGEPIANVGHRARLYFEFAYEFAKRREDYEGMKRVLLDFGMNAPMIGYASKQIQFFQEAYRLALEHAKNWTVYLCAAEYAKALLRTGDLHQSTALVADLAKVTAIRHMPTVEIRLASVGLSVAVGTQNAELLDKLSWLPLDEFLEKADEPQFLGPLIGAVHALHMYRGRRAEARKVLESGIRRLANADGAWPALASAAEFGSHATATRARRLLAALPRTHLIANAYLNLVDAFILKRQASDEEAASKAGDAAMAFGMFGWPIDVAKTLEIQGQTREALRIYKRCGATYYAGRLTENGTSKGRPRRSAIEITNRQRSIIASVLRGRTNHQIASDLNVSTSTIDHQLGDIYRRFGVHNRFELMNGIHKGAIIT